MIFFIIKFFWTTRKALAEYSASAFLPVRSKRAPSGLSGRRKTNIRRIFGERLPACPEKNIGNSSSAFLPAGRRTTNIRRIFGERLPISAPS